LTPADAPSELDRTHMQRAVEAAEQARYRVSPRPGVGCAVVATDGTVHVGATDGREGPHAEVVALRTAGPDARGATAYVTLEPCSHHGRTPPCADALIEAGVRRVVVALADPDPQVSGAGIARLRAAGIEVDVGCRAEDVEAQLWAYLVHRRTGRPAVVLKLAASLDGRTAAPDGTSRWITGPDARADAHRLRAESDAVLVGAGTVRADDPALTVRLPEIEQLEGFRQPLRVVLGRAPAGAAVHPAVETDGDLGEILDDLGARGVLQVLVEGGATVAHDFHHAGLVDRYVLYLAPVLFGGDDALGLFRGDGAATIEDVWRGSVADVRRLGADLRVDMVPRTGEGPLDAEGVI
jgi:diaminohydroxyphosphoribosylaminopyrimidine deaminase/5-amino-6-(5-phosphoribosylamino)uracil reductase